MNINLLLLLLLAAVVLGAVGWQRIRRSPEIWALRYMAKTMQSGDINDRLSSTPKSLSAMDKIFLPQILSDFPEFNWNEFKPVIQKAICEMLQAIDERNPQIAADYPRIEEQVRQVLTGTQIPFYKDVKVHDTVIKRYFRREGTCCILCESSVEYITYVEENGRVVQGHTDRKRQEVYETELVYVQDVQPAPAGAAFSAPLGTAGRGTGNLVSAPAKISASVRASATGAGVTCPNCGAPVTNLGAKRCEYCGSAVEPLNIRVWKLNAIRLM